ncbi:M23 family metallopeptidase [Oceanospirillum maris]|uniref:M23 family metallopeptidase n=1 Tax=Oceanospirillum maris TaxID=64977 RepID=UPI0003F7F196|nr:M23 family metallopeptidase [Oceanospirillum maris]
MRQTAQPCGLTQLQSLRFRRTPLLSLPFMFTLMVLALLSYASVSQAATPSGYDPKPDPMPGGVAVIELPVSLGTDEEPEAYFQGQRVFVMNRPYNRKSDNRWVAWVGIPLSTPAGKTPLTIEQPNGRNRDIIINVRPPQHNDKYMVSRKPIQKNLTSKQKRQIEQDQALVEKLIKRWSNTAPDTRTFLHPTRGAQLRAFGDRSFLNGKLLDSHNGLDLNGQRAAAPADGTVVMIRNLFYGGSTVIIDHGRGLFTHYSHLKEINFRIREGQRIRRGEEIGKIGTSGHHINAGIDYAAKIKHPHLHWGVSLNGVFVDPKLFLIEAE